jgi:hypothetical protein
MLCKLEITQACVMFVLQIKELLEIGLSGQEVEF